MVVVRERNIRMPSTPAQRGIVANAVYSFLSLACVFVYSAWLVGSSFSSSNGPVTVCAALSAYLSARACVTLLFFCVNLAG